MIRRSRLTLGLACTALALAGCAAQTIDDTKLEAKLKEGIESQTGQKVKTIACPSGRELKTGDKFTCTVTTTSGETGTIEVTQTDDKGNVRWSLKQT